MKIKQLTLQGYKTFATKTEFVFDDGITTIVGPNGSGKSNIADALRWVLGEQSYSSLRGKRTTDMIFSGSQTRSRAGMAQAILTLDNSDGWLPIDYAEVEIGRRAYRSGENEYILNGQKVRLKDVTDLLATSGLAERTYTIIGQGLIDKALSLRAEERRALFEEAAGINHYKLRRAETLRRLQETQHNLERVHDILTEIRPRLSSLKRQATRARNFDQVSADLRHLLRIWYGYKWEQVKADMRHMREVAQTAETAWLQGRQRLQKHQDHMDALRQQINQLSQQVDDKQQVHDAVRDQLEKARREVAILQERQTSIAQQLADIAQELPALQEQQAAATADLTAATAELTTAQSQLTNWQQQHQAFNQTYEAQQQQITHWQQKIRQLEQQQRHTHTQIAQAEGQITQIQERLSRREAESSSQANEELAQLNAQLETLTAVLQSAQTSLTDLQNKRQERQQQRQTVIQHLKQLRRDAHQAEKERNQQQQQIARLETRVDLLAQMRQKEAQVPAHVTVAGQFASFITIPPRYEMALAAALAHRLATLLVPDRENLWQLIDTAKASVTAAALDTVQPPPRPDLPPETAVIGWASDLITYQKVAEPIVHLLLSRVLIVSETAAAYRLAAHLPWGTMVVSLDGLLVHAGGLVETGGRFAQNTLLAREAEWRQAQEKLDTQRAELAARETAVDKQQDTIGAKQKEVDDHDREIQRLGRLANEASQRVNQAQRDLDRCQQQRDFRQRQQASQQQEINQLQDRLAHLEQQHQQQQAQLAPLDTEIEQAQAQLAALPVAEANQQRQTLLQQINATQTIVAGRQAVVDSRRTTLHQVERQLTRWQTRQASLLKQQEQLTLTQEEAAQQKLDQTLKQVEADLKPLSTRLAAVRQEMRQREEKTAVVQRQLHDLETRHTQTQIKLTQQENQLEGLQERIKADLGLVALQYDDNQTGPTPLPIGDVVEQLPQVDELPPDIESTIQLYRGQLQRMGAINPDAPAEYEATVERYDFLEQQVEDLNQTDAQLRDIIEELDDLTSRAFKETVEKVNLVFGETFTQLFGGGSAQLVLTDPDSLTVSGVDILARLPNRREQGLGLLSGGERSLTAAALIFSLLKVSPTPFCVMDEVDAALDEANVNRFRELLRELALHTQFIVITHNRGTVQVAQTIYGISMSADSTSQVISIKPEDYLTQADLL